MKICGIYTIQNTVNGKVYVGSSVNVHTRWNSHRSGLRNAKHHSAHLQAAWDIDGEDAFIFKVVKECEASELFKFEQEEFEKWKCSLEEYGYNIVPVAGKTIGFRHSIETRRKMSAIQKKIRGEPEVRKRVSEWRKSFHVSEETRMKVAAAQKGKPKHTEESKAKISAALAIRPISSDTRRKMSESAKGKSRSEETRRKMSDGAKSRKRNVQVFIGEKSFSIKEAAEYLGIPKTTFRRRMEAGEFKFERKERKDAQAGKS